MTPSEKKIYMMAYRKRNRDRIAETSKAYRGANKELVKKWRKDWTERNRESLTAKKAVWAKANRDRMNALRRARWRNGTDTRKTRAKLPHVIAYTKKAQQKWRAAHPDCSRRMYLKHQAKRRAEALARRNRDVELARAMARARRKRNPDLYNGHCKRWRKDNPAKAAQTVHRRRARLIAAPSEDCTKKIAILKTKRFCHWCCIFMPAGTATIDHVIPLARGGKHYPDNLVSACGFCNCSRGARLINEWSWRSDDSLSKEAA